MIQVSQKERDRSELIDSLFDSSKESRQQFQERRGMNCISYSNPKTYGNYDSQGELRLIKGCEGLIEYRKYLESLLHCNPKAIKEIQNILNKCPMHCEKPRNPS